MKSLRLYISLLLVTLSLAAGAGNTNSTVTLENVEGENVITLEDFPSMIAKQLCYKLETTVDSAFNYIVLGQTNGYISVDNTYITVYGIKGDGNIGVREKVTHGLTIGHDLSVSVHIIGQETSVSTMNADVTIMTDGKTITHRFDKWWYTHGGKIYARLHYMGHNATLSATCFDFSCSIWAMGDSYLGLSTRCWPFYIRRMGYFNFFYEGLGGGTSWDMYQELLKVLNYGTPKYLLWCLGMNNPDTNVDTPNQSWINHLEKVKTLCREKDITLIIATIPNVPKRINTAKNTVVRESGYRYIDFARAVGGEETGSSWNEGLLHTDALHPSELGAQALAQQVVIDFSEITTLGNDMIAGDVNLDGEIDMRDLNALINIILNKDKKENYPGRVDVDGDGIITIMDINIVINVILNKAPSRAKRL